MNTDEWNQFEQSTSDEKNLAMANPEEPKNDTVLAEEMSGENNAECPNMGSNDQTEQMISEQVAEPAAAQEIHQSHQELPADGAEKVPEANSANKNFGEKEEKNVWILNMNEIEPKETDGQPDGANCLPEWDDSKPAEEAPQEHVAKNSDENTKMAESLPVAVNSDNVDISPQEQEAVQPEPVACQPAQEDAVMEYDNVNNQDDGSPSKNLSNSTRKQSLPKRVLRDRKFRLARNADQSSKCHICEKNSLRWTLIPWTRGADDCEIYFWNIWIKKFNQSMAEDDYDGIECPVCQGIWSCERCKKSVLEEDLK